MATLTETAYLTRRIIKYGVAFAVFLIFLRIAWTVGFSVYRHFFPPPPPEPTVAFGKLPALPFPEKEQVNYSFTLETPTGQLPTMPLAANVYFMPQATSSFLDLEDATRKAQGMGFTGQATSLAETLYKFEHPQEAASLEMNIVNKNFSLNYNLSTAQHLLRLRPKSAEEAVARARSFLASGGLLHEDLAQGPTTTELIKAEPPNLVRAISLSETNFVRVNFFRQNVDELPVLTPKQDNANVWFLVSGSGRREEQVIAGEYHYFPIDLGNPETYPLKTSQQAWEDLTGRNAYIASGPQKGGNIVIRRIFLAYYDSSRPAQPFLQPIVVFEGDEFLAYVPAIAPEWYGQSQE